MQFSPRSIFPPPNILLNTLAGGTMGAKYFDVLDTGVFLS
jgi:hypothetical protein